MASPDRNLSFIFGLDSDAKYNERQFVALLDEMYESEKYRNMQIPVGTGKGALRMDAVHIAAFAPSGNIQLYEFIPGHSHEDEDKLRYLLRQQLGAYDIGADLDAETAYHATELLQEDGLHVIGGFQLGTLVNGMRSVELIYPELFEKFSGSDNLAADISAYYLKAVHEATSQE